MKSRDLWRKLLKVKAEWGGRADLSSFFPPFLTPPQRRMFQCTLYSLSRDLKKFKEWSLPRDSVMNELLPKVVSISLRVFELLVPIFPRNWNYILEPTYECEFSTSLFLNLLFKRRNGITFVAFQFWAVIYV